VVAVAAAGGGDGEASSLTADLLAAPGPHPRAGPEAVALLAARLLARGCLAAAAAHAAGPVGGPARGLALAPAAAALAGADPGRLTVTGSAGPSLRASLVAVEEVVGGGGGGRGRAPQRPRRALFELCLKDSGCWAVRGTEGW